MSNRCISRVASLLKIDQTGLENTLKTVLQEVDKSNAFMKKHIPPLAKTITQNQKGVAKNQKRLDTYTDEMKELRREVDELTHVWSQEEEKTKNMNKLLTALFQEVHDMESHGKMIDNLMKQV